MLCWWLKMTLISYQHTARRGDKKYAPREVDIAMRIIAIASYKKRVRLEAELHIGQSGQWPPLGLEIFLVIQSIAHMF
jgi:hypothetical protein